MQTLEQQRAWRAANPEKCRAYAKASWQKHRIQRMAEAKKWVQENRTKMRKYARDYYAAHNSEEKKKRRCEQKKKENRALKLGVIEAYGGACACCGIAGLEFLTVDHVYRDGKEHRSKVGGGGALYWWLKKNGYPKDRFRLLCWNCNCSRGFFGYCPHHPEMK